MKKKLFLVFLSFLLATSVYAVETKSSYIKKAKSLVKELTPKQAYKSLQEDSSIFLLNVSVKDEHDKYHIKGSHLIPRGLIEFYIEQNKLYPEINKGEVPEKDQKIFVYCTKGGRGLLAAKTLLEMGYTNISNIKGGMSGWMASKLPIER